MFRKISAFIIRSRYIILAVFLLLTAGCAAMINRTVINYDFTTYLNEKTVTRQSLNIMYSEFGNIDQLSIMLEDPCDNVTQELTDLFNETEGIMRAVYSKETDSKTVDGKTYERINLFLETPDSVAFVGEVRDILAAYSGSYADYYLSGAAASTLGLEERIMREMPIAMLIAVIVVAAVLFLTSHSWIEPAIFAIVLIVSIIINMGTNFIFDSISFVTFAVCAILQLALAMDYSIMLLHTFFEIRDSGADDVSAMVTALADSFMPVSSSALTTVAGLISLMFMSFTIGFDIGIVLAKGIIISMLTVFTFMPAVILIFRKPLRTTMHKTVPLGGRHTASLAWAGRKVIPVILIAAICVGCVLQYRNVYTFSDTSSAEKNQNPVTRVFGMSNQLVLLVPAKDTDDEYDKQREFIRRAYEIQYDGRQAITDVTAMITTGEAAIKYYTADEIAEMLKIPKLAVSVYLGAMGFSLSARGDVLIAKAAEIMTDNKQVQDLKATCDFAKAMFLSENYSRIILMLDVPTFGEDAYAVVDEIISLLDEFWPGEKTGIAGNLMSSYDISNAFNSDILKVSLITIIAIFLIILLSFRNAVIPLMLICVIQGAVWVNMSLSYITGNTVFFMSYLITLAIQMGATIDYGILMTTNYRAQRKLTADRKTALVHAAELSMPTIFTSGLILVVAGFAIGKICTVYYISSIGLMLARGTLVSLIMILLLLPPLLLNLDRMVTAHDSAK